MNIAIFGGSFNPVHNEHVNIISHAIKDLKLDKVIVIPTFITPQKTDKITASCQDRLNMCRLAFGDTAEVSDFEISRGGVSYSYITCEEFKKKYKNDDIYFILGADMYESFPLWKYPERILNCVKLAVCSREKPITLSSVPAVYINYTGGAVSSTRIRALAALGEDISGYVGENVANYIKAHGIYKIENISKVKDFVTEKRWKHIVGVTVFAVENCAKVGVPEKKAIIAAAFHDCAKYLDLNSKELSGFVCPQGVPEPVVHQYSGAYLAEHYFGIKDEDILNAIRYHTSGRENMSPLEKLIFSADILEEGRSFEGVEKLRKIYSEDSERGLLEIFRHTLSYLENSGDKIYPLTEKAYRYLSEEHKNDK